MAINIWNLNWNIDFIFDKNYFYIIYRWFWLEFLYFTLSFEHEFYLKLNSKKKKWKGFQLI
jgi:hypothetical protein